MKMNMNLKYWIGEALAALGFIGSIAFFLFPDAALLPYLRWVMETF